MMAVQLERTPPRGWAVILLFRAQQSSVILVSYTFGLFLPFIREDLSITPLQAGLLQGVWWITAAGLSLPFGAWFSRFRPVPLALVSLVLGAPFLFVQALAPGFWLLLLGRFCFILFHTVNTPARALLLRQWCAPHQYALVQSMGLSQHSVILALAVSLSPWVIEGLGSWRIAYAVLGCFFTAQILAWVLVAREKHAPPPPPSPTDEEDEQSPWLALRRFPQGWLIAVVMLFLSSTWTGIVTFLPTLWVDERGISLTLGGPLLGFLYYGLIPGGFLGGWLLTKLHSRKALLVVPALLNAVFGVSHHTVRGPAAADGVHHRAGAGLGGDAGDTGAALRVSRSAAPGGSGADRPYPDLHGCRIRHRPDAGRRGGATHRLDTDRFDCPVSNDRAGCDSRTSLSR